MFGVGEQREHEELERVARRYEGHRDEGERWRRQVVEERGYLQVVDEGVARAARLPLCGNLCVDSVDGVICLK